MTQPASERGKSQKRPYAYATNVTKGRSKNYLTTVEISALFVRAGWLGRRRPRTVTSIWAEIDEYNDIHMGSI